MQLIGFKVNITIESRSHQHSGSKELKTTSFLAKPLGTAVKGAAFRVVRKKKKRREGRGGGYRSSGFQENIEETLEMVVPRMPCPNNGVWCYLPDT